MRHHDNIRKFGRERKVRVALLRSLALSLILKGRIKTTEAKAKEIRPYVEKLVTHGKKPGVASARLLRSRIGSESAVKKLMSDLASKYKTQNGGYTRIVKLPRRISDGSKMAVIEFV